jgi:CxxC-x17-CxxC domain-containing protein
MAFEDKDLVCRECSETFTFTAGEQEFYQTRGLLHEPARCPACRTARRRGGGGGFRSDQPRTMYPAVCASCGTNTEVPFEPRQGRPVYCKECYDTQGRVSTL